MDFEKQLNQVLNNSEISEQDKISQIADIGDYLKYGDIDRETAIIYLDILIRYLVKQNNDDVKEEMLGIILDTEDARVIDKELDLTPIISNLSHFNVQCISYVLSILGYSGRKDYIPYIEKFKEISSLEEDVEDALYELKYRSENN
ncbi:hypothetical protein JZO73_14825 [Enterococcus plantarum]|uniref:hypothetical protein n=1 Tax=Enterococcus plantarum TaxID=1077675 RepID=UPI001A8DB3B0|nr:hypothetical protein [Enterococcus plantarum]MBO0468774.1 hypothetical protein [Enterococcus plantarum]